MLVVQDDILDASALATVTVAPLTPHVRRAEATGNILLSPSQSGLDRPSVVLACQLMTLNGDFFDEFVGSSRRACHAA